MFAPRIFDQGGPVKFEQGGIAGMLGAASIFNDGRSAAWAGATPAGCPYSDPGLRAGQAERRARHG